MLEGDGGDCPDQAADDVIVVDAFANSADAHYVIDSASFSPARSDLV